MPLQNQYSDWQSQDWEPEVLEHSILPKVEEGDFGGEVYIAEKAPKPLPKQKLADILVLLRDYHFAVHTETTLSSASKTTQGTQSVATSATHITGTSVFSFTDNEPQLEGEKKPLDVVLRKRKALFRKMKTCEDCRESKTKCEFKHHRLRDLHLTEHKEEDENIIEWALRTNGKLESQMGQEMGPVTSHPSSQPWAPSNNPQDRRSQYDVINSVDTKFSLDSQPMNISPRLELSPAPQNESPPIPYYPALQSSMNFDSIQTYSISSSDDMFAIGRASDIVDPSGAKYYECEKCPRLCTNIGSLQDHYKCHQEYNRMADCLRIVCQNCGFFSAIQDSNCLYCFRQGFMEKVYGQSIRLSAVDTASSFVGRDVPDAGYMDDFDSYIPGSTDGYLNNGYPENDNWG